MNQLIENGVVYQLTDICPLPNGVGDSLFTLKYRMEHVWNEAYTAKEQKHVKTSKIYSNI